MEHVCFFRGASRSTQELIAAKIPNSICTLYLINRYVAFTKGMNKTLCQIFVGVIIGTAICLFVRSRGRQSKARGEEGHGLVNGELSDGSIKKPSPFISSSPAPPVGEKKGPFSLLGCSSPRSKQRAPTRSIIDMYKQQAGPALHLSKWTPGEHPPAEAAALTEIARAFLSNTQSAGLSTADELRPELAAVATKAAATQVRVRANPNRNPNPNSNPNPNPNPSPNPNPNPKQVYWEDRKAQESDCRDACKGSWGGAIAQVGEPRRWCVHYKFTSDHRGTCKMCDEDPPTLSLTPTLTPTLAPTLTPISTVTPTHPPPNPD